SSMLKDVLEGIEVVKHSLTSRLYSISNHSSDLQEYEGNTYALEGDNAPLVISRLEPGVAGMTAVVDRAVVNNGSFQASSSSPSQCYSVPAHTLTEYHNCWNYDPQLFSIPGSTRCYSTFNASSNGKIVEDPNQGYMDGWTAAYVQVRM